MIFDLYNDIVKDYKNYMEANSQYYEANSARPLVVKGYSSTSAYFPIISIQFSNVTNTNSCTIDMIEKYNEAYITIDIYTKNKNVNNATVASELINDELTNLTMRFFESINMKITMCMLTPNMDTSILRRTIQAQGLVGTARKNIIRRWKIWLLIALKIEHYLNTEGLLY